MLGLAGAGLLFAGLLAGILWPTGQPISPPAQQTRPAPPKTLVVAGDISCEQGSPKTTYNCRSDDTAALVTSIKPDAVLTVGDNQYPKGELVSYQQAYDKTWGAFKDSTYPTPGNHEYGTPEASGYFDYFGARAGEPGKGYYSYKIGDWLFVALNSEIAVSSGSEQLTWLEQELKNNPSTCTLAYWHKPRFSTGGHASDPTYDALWRVLYAQGVDIVVNGHSHNYERYLPQNPDGVYDPEKGITEFVSGMGGYGLEGLSTPLSNLVTRQNHAFGVLKLSLYPKSAHYQFVPIPGQQTFTDTGTVACH